MRWDKTDFTISLSVKLVIYVGPVRVILKFSLMEFRTGEKINSIGCYFPIDQMQTSRKLRTHICYSIIIQISNWEKNKASPYSLNIINLFHCFLCFFILKNNLLTQINRSDNVTFDHFQLIKAENCFQISSILISTVYFVSRDSRSQFITRRAKSGTFPAIHHLYNENKVNVCLRK